MGETHLKHIVKAFRGTWDKVVKKKKILAYAAGYTPVLFKDKWEDRNHLPRIINVELHIHCDMKRFLLENIVTYCIGQ